MIFRNEETSKVLKSSELRQGLKVRAIWDPFVDGEPVVGIAVGLNDGTTGLPLEWEVVVENIESFVRSYTVFGFVRMRTEPLEERCTAPACGKMKDFGKACWWCGTK